MDCDLVGEAVDDLLFEMEGFTEAGGAGGYDDAISLSFKLPARDEDY